MTVTIIRTSGVEEVHEVAHDEKFWRTIEGLIEATALDHVNLRDGRVMLVDDGGWETEHIDHGDGRHELRPTKARKPVNARATLLYHGICKPGVTHQIAGDVAIVLDKDFE